MVPSADFTSLFSSQNQRHRGRGECVGQAIPLKLLVVPSSAFQSDHSHTSLTKHRGTRESRPLTRSRVRNKLEQNLKGHSDRRTTFERVHECLASEWLNVHRGSSVDTSSSGDSSSSFSPMSTPQPLWQISSEVSEARQPSPQSSLITPLSAPRNSQAQRTPHAPAYESAVVILLGSLLRFLIVPYYRHWRVLI